MSESAPKPAEGAALVDVVVVDELRDTPTEESSWAMVEVWTQRSRYHIDPLMRCIEVIDLATETSVPDHGLIGARLLGGQRREEGRTYLSHPFPRPGSEAVFEKSNKGDVTFSHSSPVSRVVLRLRELGIATGEEQGEWSALARNSAPDTKPSA